MRISLSLVILLICVPTVCSAQNQQREYQPYIDMQRFHLGFSLGVNLQDMMLAQRELGGDSEKWIAEIPDYRLGFTAGIITDFYISRFLNVRFSPSICIGSKQILFKELVTNKVETNALTSTYLLFPFDLKYSSLRLKNYRPYLIGGLYGCYDFGRKKEEVIKIRREDWGISIGVGIDIYRPYFKLCPEIRFYFGLRNVWNDNVEEAYVKQSVKRAGNKLFSIVFNFE